MAERQATENVPIIRLPLLASEERLAESTREPGTQLKHGSKDGSSRYRRAFTEAADQDQYGSDTPSRLHPRGLKRRGRYYAQDESGTFIVPPERLPEHSSIGKNVVWRWLFKSCGSVAKTSPMCGFGNVERDKSTRR